MVKTRYKRIESRIGKINCIISTRFPRSRNSSNHLLDECPLISIFIHSTINLFSSTSKNSKERQKFLFLILDRSGNAIERNPFEIIDDPFFFYPLRGELKGICARSTTHFSPPPRKSLDDQASQTSPSLAIIIIITIIIPSSRKMGEKKGARNVGAERERSGIKETGEGRLRPSSFG